MARYHVFGRHDDDEHAGHALVHFPDHDPDHHYIKCTARRCPADHVVVLTDDELDSYEARLIDAAWSIDYDELDAADDPYAVVRVEAIARLMMGPS